MKLFKSIFGLCLIFSVGLLFTACGGEQSQSGADQTEEAAGHDHDGHDHGDHAGHDHGNADAKMGAAYTSAYVCPMHCEGSGSATAGTCPVCKMDYVARAEHEKDGHNHN